MNINELLKGVDCTCNRHHSCDIKYVYVEENAASRLKMICKNFNKIVLVADENTYAAAGAQVEAVISDKLLESVIFSGKNVVIPDENAIKAIEEKSFGADLILGIGSGVIQDLCKFVSFKLKIPYIIFATAPSMDGYASSVAAMLIKGMRDTSPAHVPLAILADAEVLANAPKDMIRAGYGDIIGKFTALNDWKLSHALTGEYFCNYIYKLTMDTLENTIKLSSGLLCGDKKSISALMEALITVGIAMSFAGCSRPASGSEHHMSHYFEISGIVFSKPYFPHGIDVAYSAVLAAKMCENLLTITLPDSLPTHDQAQYIKNMENAYGSVAPGYIKLQEKSGWYSRDRLSLYKEHWDEIVSICSEMPTAEEIIKLIEAVGIKMSDFYDEYSNRRIFNARLYAKDLRERFTVLWLNYDLENI